jgi:hypothetical protein
VTDDVVLSGSFKNAKVGSAIVKQTIAKMHFKRRFTFYFS